jgi:CheY-like chemotaxis protein
LEEQLKKSQKMEAMGKLAAGVAHDLNNILSGIVSYPELLLLELPNDSPMRTKIEKIQDSGKRAADMVQDLLMIARRGVKVHVPVHINQTIQTTMETLEFKQLTESNSKIQIHSDLADDTMFIMGSSLHISKVIMNMVRNASEAMPTGGTINIRTTNRYLDAPLDRYECIPEGEYVIISIIDEGIGIPIDNLQQIFEPFYSKKRMGKSGSGLGMTIVWNTIKDHCGYMDIQSREGEGTRFEIYLPAVRDADIAEKSHVVLEDYIGNERILVVDDIAEQRDIAVRMLSRLGYQVASVSSGETALNYIQKNAVDLVVLDMVMPQSIDGLETYRRILEFHPGQKAIIASGYSASERVKEMHKLGAGEYIRKPYTLEKIGLAVRNELDR